MGLRNRNSFLLRICMLAIYLCVWTGCGDKTSVDEETEVLVSEPVTKPEAQEANNVADNILTENTEYLEVEDEGESNPDDEGNEEYASNTDSEDEEYLDPAGLIPLDLEYLANWGVSEAIWKVPDTYYSWAIVNTQSGETEYYPYFTLELSDDGTGWCETEEEYFELVWYKGEDLTVTLEGNEQIYYLSIYMDPVLGFDGLYFSMQMNEKVVWLYNITN